MSYHGMLQFFSFFFLKKNLLYVFFKKKEISLVSMGIVGAKSTARREVKFIDPSKTTESESTWLGFSLCDINA
jgi:hypothetical protein